MRGPVNANSSNGVGFFSFADISDTGEHKRIMHNKRKRRASTRRILVVDDDPVTLKLLQGLFSYAGVMVDTAQNAEEAERLYSTKTYSLITLDCHMPGTDGVTLHRMLSTRFGFGRSVSPMLPQRLPPILVITGTSELALIRELVCGERIVGVLQKPIKCAELLQITEDLLAKESARADRRSTAVNRLLKHGVKVEQAR